MEGESESGGWRVEGTFERTSPLHLHPLLPLSTLTFTLTPLHVHDLQTHSLPRRQAGADCDRTADCARLAAGARSPSDPGGHLAVPAARGCDPALGADRLRRLARLGLLESQLSDRPQCGDFVVGADPPGHPAGSHSRTSARGSCHSHAGRPERGAWSQRPDRRAGAWHGRSLAGTGKICCLWH